MKSSNKILDRICATFFGIVGLLVFFATLFTVDKGKSDPLGGQFFPLTVGAILIILSVILFVSTYFYKKDDEDKKPTRNRWLDYLKTVIFCAILFACFNIFANINYFISTFIMTTSMLLLSKVKKVYWYLIVYACIALIYIIFTYLLGMQL